MFIQWNWLSSGKFIKIFSTLKNYIENILLLIYILCQEENNKEMMDNKVFFFVSP